MIASPHETCPENEGIVPLPSHSTSPKSDTIFLWIIGSWICLVLYFDPRLFALASDAPTLFAAAAILLFIACLNFFWFHVVYQTFMIGAALWLKRKPRMFVSCDGLVPRKVAILYTTRNDFREVCSETCLAFRYPDFHLFILDDSTIDTIRYRIDAWAAPRASRVTVIRRPEQKGFKAGNLNHALRLIQADYPFFVICDADSIMPPDFIAVLLPIIEARDDIAFAQARQEQYPMQIGTLPSAMGNTIGAHYRYFVRPRDATGFVMFYGHGALMRTSVWKTLGGFPEITTEDLAYTAEIRLRGFHGIYLDNPACFEDYPPTYGHYRKRAEKWIRGTSEFLKLHYPAFFRSPIVPWFEKLDVLINASAHYQTTIMLIFMLAAGAILPSFFAHFRYPGSFFLMPVPEGKSLFEFLSQIRYHIFWSPDFYTVMVLTIVVPLIPAFLDLWRKPGRLLSHLVWASFLFLGSMVAEAYCVIAFLITGRAEFRATHDPQTSIEGEIRGFHINHPLISWAELAFGILFAWIGWRTQNLWFFAPASALSLSPFVLRYGTDRLLIRVAAVIPFLIGLLILALVTMDLVISRLGSPGLYDLDTVSYFRRLL